MDKTLKLTRLLEKSRQKLLKLKERVMAKKPSSGDKSYRSAETGRYVTKKTADKNPKTTVAESRPKPNKPGKKG